MRVRRTIVGAAVVAVTALTGTTGIVAAPALAASAPSRCVTTAPSDFDGDGRTDAVIPVPGKHRTAGQAVLFRGSSAGMVPDRVLRPGLDGVPGTDAAGAEFGSDVATGTSGNGCGDVAILADQAAEPRVAAGTTEIGGITVLYGVPGAGLGTRHSQLVTSASLHLAPPSVPGSDGHPLVRRISSPVFGDFFGRDSTDLAYVETTYATGTGDQTSSPSVVRIVVVQVGSTGRLSIASGSTLLVAAPSLATGHDGTFAGGRVTLAAGQAHGVYPASLAVVVGGRGDTPNGPVRHGDVTTHGVVDVLQGGSHFPESTAVWDQESPGVPGTDSGRLIGIETAVWGDFDGDGFDDLAFADEAQGVVTVLYGDGGVLSADGAQRFRPGRGGVPASTGFGRTLAAGDFNGDSDDELAVASQDGSVTVLPGTHAHGLVTLNPLHWTQSTAGVPGDRERGSAWGARMLVGKFGTGPWEDLAVSDPIADGRAGSATELFGHRSPNVGLGTAGARLFTESSPGVPGLAIADDRFGGD